MKNSQKLCNELSLIKVMIESLIDNEIGSGYFAEIRDISIDVDILMKQIKEVDDFEDLD